MNRVAHVFIQDALNFNECWSIVRAAQALPVICADMGANKELPEIRSSMVRWIYRNNQQFAWLFDRLLPLVNTANASNFGFDIEELDSLQFTEYHGDRQGRYDFHVDTFWETSSTQDRKLSFVLQLSDPSSYVGGDLHIHCNNHPDPTAMRKQGSMVIFCSMIEHGVLPVTRGTRYSLVGWASGNRFR